LIVAQSAVRGAEENIVIQVVPKNYWLYSCSTSDSNLDKLYKDGWRAVQMTASADGDTVILLLEKGASSPKN
jgi:hypothetical protein